MAIVQLKEIKTALLLLLVLSLLTGVIYPTLTTCIAMVCYPKQAQGSLITHQDKVIGSALIGQSFIDPSNFWGRPSMTLPFPYNAAQSSGSNLGPTNAAFLKLIQNRVELLQHVSLQPKSLVPVELVTASGSGLDPDISPLAAYYQIPRIAKIRGVPEADLRLLIDQAIIPRFLGVFGEPRVNVLLLNLILKDHYERKTSQP